MLSRRLTMPIAVGAAAIVVVAGAYGIDRATSGSSSASASTTSTPASTTPAPKAGSNARSGPAAGGSSGTVSSVSKSSFTLTTATDEKVTIDKASSTKYEKGTSATTASAVKKGVSVLVLGTTSGTTIKATQVILQPTGSGEAKSSSAAKVSKKVGQIPSSYSEGAGTIVGGTTANKATEAALAAYPGGVVDRVVKLSSADYEVHYIGVNWPHHIFVNTAFKVIGAE
jgi:hypothetical protein